MEFPESKTVIFQWRKGDGLIHATTVVSGGGEVEAKAGFIDLTLSAMQEALETVFGPES